MYILFFYVYFKQKNGYTYSFEFDAIFDEDSSQKQVFNEVEPFITSALDGFNVCIFAYGQTGSGKTYTMQGPDDNPGVNPNALSLMFEEIAKKTTVEYHVTVSVLEIYNECIIDLLKGGRNNGNNLNIRQSKEGGNYIENLSEIGVTSFDEVIGLLNTAGKNRSVGCHNLNEHSSRSHLVLTVHIKGFNTKTKKNISSMMNLIDLAGSERAGKTGVTGEGFEEAKAINKSVCFYLFFLILLFLYIAYMLRISYEFFR